MKQVRIKQFAIAALAAAGLTLTTPSLAASSCKGLEKSRCASSSSCTWVDSYTTQKGNKVAAYCRSKGGDKSGAKSSSKKSAGENTSAKKAGTSQPAKEKSSASKSASS
ncbi:MAG: chromosome partitioning protein ParB [Zoogloeaceae bacterium]|nr:hypothetical protein [Rhodocyclaceae bacterium]MCP5236403.1 chromosome partitioning protein ParB [Zoogloeaceae bacterium]